MKKIFLVYGHYNEKSFNASIRKTFIKTVEAKGHVVDVVDLYKEKFDPVFAGEEPSREVLDHRKRIEASDVIVLIAPIWNFRMPAIVEGWIDKVLAPPWAFRFKKIFGNYGYPIGNLSGKKAIVFCTYGSPQFAIRTFFLNMPTKRLRRGVFNICGISDVTYKRFFAVPFVSDDKRQKFLKDVIKSAIRI
jgi:NAD(P)H dehydrogenase (quinone)|tara:strand:+ start:945 stop:1514 length:570 start_codon:yes stop_codon:yes gene_type:complete